MKKILELLGLPEGATEEQIGEALAAVVKTSAKFEKQLKSSGEYAAKLEKEITTLEAKLSAQEESEAPEKIIEALGLKNPSDDEILEAILALKKNAKAVIELSEFDKKVQARMTKGRISKEAATLAQKHQDETDKLVAKRDKATKK